MKSYRHVLLALCLVFSLVLFPVMGLAQPTSSSSVALHRFATTERSWAVNAYWLESNQGIVLIDTLLLKSDATLLAAMMKQTGKPLAGIIITHPHIDHFGGMGVIRATYPDVPVYATRATVDGMRDVHDRAIKAGWISRMFGDDYEADLVLPDQRLESGAELELAGMHFTLTDIGAVDAANNTVVYNAERNELFSGDATVSNAAVYVGEGHTRQAMQALAMLQARFGEVRRVHSGHYDSMRPQPLFADNLAQLHYLREAVRSRANRAENRTPDGALTDAARNSLVDQVATHFAAYHNYGYGPKGFASFNLPALEKEILAEMRGQPDTEDSAANKKTGASH